MIRKNSEHSEIPYGEYCCGKNFRCPYWELKEYLPVQYNGYCNFLKKGDIEISSGLKLINCQTGVIEDADDLPFPVSLLWDGVKECGINIGYSEDEHHE